MNKKYELTDETKEIGGITLHRIRALMDISRYGVRAGDIGGWIEAESNLSQDGDAWVGGDARVCGNARVYGDAQVYGNAIVYGYARASDNARVSGDARVFGNALVFGDAWVYGNAEVYGNAIVYGYARVSDNARVSGNARVTETRGSATTQGSEATRASATTRGSEADALVVGGMVEAMRREKRGNAAKIREALVRCADIINEFGLAEIVKTPIEVICDIEGIITAALSAPPRNCDIYDAESCRMAYHIKGDGLMTMQAFADWLFAPVEEGGAK